MEPVQHSGSATTKKFVFSQQIGVFSDQLRQGAYVSAMNYSKETDCNWTLFIEQVREFKYGSTRKYDDYIELSLRRSGYRKEYQSLEVSLTVMDSFKRDHYYASKTIHYTPFLNEEIVLRITKSELFGNYRFTIRDIFTVKCEITAHASKGIFYDARTYVDKKVWELLKLLMRILLILFAGFSLLQSFIIWYNSYTFFEIEILLLKLTVIIIIWMAMRGGDRTYYPPILHRKRIRYI